MIQGGSLLGQAGLRLTQAGRGMAVAGRGQRVDSGVGTEGGWGIMSSTFSSLKQRDHFFPVKSPGRGIVWVLKGSPLAPLPFRKSSKTPD